MIDFIFISKFIAASILNVNRGRCPLGTTAGRLIIAIGLGLMTWNPIVAIGIFIWSVFGWGRYFAAIHGNISDEKEFYPVDWLMSKLPIPIKTLEQRKLWGLLAMTLRESIIIPTIIIVHGNPFPALLMGLSYYVGGKISQTYSVLIAEVFNGLIIWWMLCQI